MTDRHPTTFVPSTFREDWMKPLDQHLAEAHAARPEKDQRCPQCSGRGYHGALDAPATTVCHVCIGTGRIKAPGT